MEGVGCTKVMIIQDAAKDVSWSAIRSILHSLVCKPGDQLLLLRVLQQVNNPYTLSFTGAKKMLGYKNKVDSDSLIGSSSKLVKEEIARKTDEYRDNVEMLEILQQCEQEKIKFSIKVLAGTRIVAIEAAVNFEATWVVLDRQMKKDKKHYIEKLSCGISRIKHDNTIGVLRGPKMIDSKEETELTAAADKSIYADHVSYGEMIPGSPKDERSPKKSPSSQGNILSIVQDGGDDKKSDALFKSSLTDQTLSSTSSSSISNTEASTPSFIEEFENAVCSVCKNRRPKAQWKREFTYAELQEATQGFSDKKFLSEGGFGCVYEGELRDGLKVAVKQYKDASNQGEKEFKSEVHVLSKARHPNLVMLLGSCSQGNHRLLVYEYVCNGSLDQHLSKHTRKLLNWSKRVKIALGTAKGLQFLHKHNIIHRDVRPSNILVTHDYESLLGDFGLARNEYEDAEHSLEKRVVGTLGYLAPEYAENGKASTKTDVYSFGVVLLQLITGLRITDTEKLEGISLVEWATPLLVEKNYPKLLDKKLEESHDVHQLFWMVTLAEKCLRLDPTRRYTMTSVVNALHYIIEGYTSFIKDFSPTKSDSLNSATGSTQSHDELAVK